MLVVNIMTVQLVSRSGFKFKESGAE